MRWKLHLRLLLLPLFILGLLSLGFIICIFLEAMAGKLGIWIEPFCYFIIGITVITPTYFATPYLKRSITLFVCACGAIIAWRFLHSAFYPEGHPKAYQYTYLPLIGAYCGLLVGYGLALLIEKKQKMKTQQSGPAYPPQGVGSADP